MRKVQAETLHSFDDYALVDADIPSPAEGEVLIRVASCGFGYVDALLAKGGYQVKPQLPFTPGQEVAGTVTAVGAAVTNLSIGDRVMGQSFGGGFAEFVVLPQSAVRTIPDAMSFDQAAVFRINYLTAMHALTDRADLRAGERVLVFGAAGGVGAAVVQLANLMGAHVIAVGSTSEKRDFAVSQGARSVIDTDQDGWRDRLRALTGSAGPDVVVDPVCGPLFELAFRSLAWRGRHLVVGFAGGPFPKLPVNLPLMKGAALVGVDVRQFMENEPARVDRHITELLSWVNDKRLSPPVGRRFPLSDFRAAMDDAISGSGLGKAVVDLS